MTRVDHALSQVGAPGMLTTVARAVSRHIVQPMRQEMHRRRTVAELNRLSNRLLDDIGIVPGDIEVVAARAVGLKDPSESLTHRLTQSIRKAWTRRAMIRRFESMPDWLLEDIGIPRWRIHEAVDNLLAEPTREPQVTVSVPSSPVHELRDRVKAAVRSLRQWHLSRHAAGQMARLNGGTLADLGYVKGDVDWVPEVLAKRELDRAANENASRSGAA